MLTFEHANANCTGSQLRVDMKPASNGDCGTFTFEIVPQSSAPKTTAKGRRIQAEFSGNAAFATLNVKKIAHILIVLEGKARETRNGKGVYDNGDGYVSLLHCDRVYEPASGFAFHVITRMDGETEPREGRIFLNATESMALAKSISSSMGRAAFGD